MVHAVRPGAVDRALSGVQREGSRWARGPAWALAGTQGEQAAGATASLLQPSEVLAEGSGEVGTRALGQASGCRPGAGLEELLDSQGGQRRQLRSVGAAGGWGLSGSSGELQAHPARPEEAGNALS